MESELTVLMCRNVKFLSYKIFFFLTFWGFVRIKRNVCEGDAVLFREGSRLW